MSASYNDLEKKLLEAGEKLLDPLPSSNPSLLRILDVSSSFTIFVFVVDV